MSREKKTQIIDELQEILSKSKIGILTDYRGLTAAQINSLRRKLRESGTQYRVVKNTLAQFAAQRAGRNELASLFEGPVAIAFGYDDMTEPAKTLVDYIRASRLELSIKSGFLSDSLLTSANVMTLATLPTREILISQVLAGMQGPITNLVSLLAAPIQGIMGALQARINQLEGE
ncbi:50S ribosomal protein L10 [Chloroflexota bacterium]